MSKQGNVVVRANSGANVGTRRRLNILNGANTTAAVTDSGPNDEVTIQINAAVAGGTILANHNGGAPVGPARPELSFVDGVNTAWVINDDAVNNEIDIQVNAMGVGGGAWLSQFYPAPDPNIYKATYPAVLLEDTYDVPVWQTFMIPSDIVTVTQAVIIVIPEGTGNIRWQCSTNFAGVCVNEVYNTHTDSIAATTTGITLNEVECLDISAALTGAAGDDLVGIQFTRTGSHVDDTVNADVFYVGILIRGSTEQE